MLINQPGRPPTWLWLFGDIWFAVLVFPAIGSAYLIGRNHIVAGFGVLAAWIVGLWLAASEMDRRRYARRWIILTGGVCVFAVSLLVFTFVVTP